MKFLIVRLSSLGDIIHSLPIVCKLRQKYPDAQIDWLVREKGFELLNLINEIDNVYLLNLKNIFLIQKQKYETAQKQMSDVANDPLLMKALFQLITEMQTENRVKQSKNT